MRLPRRASRRRVRASSAHWRVSQAPSSSSGRGATGESTAPTSWSSTWLAWRSAGSTRTSPSPRERQRPAPSAASWWAASGAPFGAKTTTDPAAMHCRSMPGRRRWPFQGDQVRNRRKLRPASSSQPPPRPKSAGSGTSRGPPVWASTRATSDTHRTTARPPARSLEGTRRSAAGSPPASSTWTSTVANSAPRERPRRSVRPSSQGRTSSRSAASSASTQLRNTCPASIAS